MRKEVKFGLTIGAILAVTVIVWAIALNRGNSDNSPEVKLVGSAPEPAAPAVNPATLPSATPGSHLESAAPGDFTARGDLAPANLPPHPLIGTAGAPAATEPSATADRPSWETLLSQGDAALTQTPSPASHPPVTSGQQPLIDNEPRMLSVMPAPPAGAAAPAAVTPPPATLPAPAQAGPRKYRVAPGDTLSTIAKTMYGSEKHWDKILSANPGIDPKHLKIGQVLVIPDISALPVSSSASDHGADLPAPSPAAVPETAIDPATSYKVLQGDSLETIAIKLYGNRRPDTIQKLYDANKPLMGDDINKLKIGWILKLPQPPTTGGTASAAGHAAS